MHSEEFVGLAELSKRISLSPRTLRSSIQACAHPLPAYKVGGKWLFKWTEVQTWIEQHRFQPVDVSEILQKFGNLRSEKSDRLLIKKGPKNGSNENRSI